MLGLFEVLSIYSVLFYFTVYSFLGWLIENIYSFFTTKLFFKEGFFIGPFKPMYGFAPVLLISLISEDTHWLTAILICLAIPTLIEYISGFLLYSYFHRRWWDYSNIPLQLHGHICLSFSICWVLLSIVCLKWVHPPLAYLYETIQYYWVWLSPLVFIYFLTELYFAIKRHLPEHSSLPSREKGVKS